LKINAQALIFGEIRLRRMKCLAEPSVKFLLRKSEMIRKRIVKEENRLRFS
jgi:hypothetical protein